MALEPIPPEMLAECRRLVRAHYGSGTLGLDAMMLAGVFARGMQHTRQLDKDDRDAYEAERAEWEAERAEQEANPTVIDFNIRLPDDAVEKIKARLVAAMKSGRAELAPEPATFEPIRKIRREAAQKERDEIGDYINKELNAIRPEFDEAREALGEILEWLEKRNESANRERDRGDQAIDKGGVRKPGRTG